MGRAVVRISKDELRDRLGISDYISLTAVQFNLLTDRVELVFEGSRLPNCADGCEPLPLSFEDPALNAI